MKKFDLNIEKILENWDATHAIREIISNALDEQNLTATKEVEIYKNVNSWIIRDFGRGIKYTHLTQNENQEKLSNPHVIGKFGIGLKDALATFDRRGIIAVAKSKFGIIKTEKIAKQGFNDITTLHAIIEDSVDVDFEGTEFVIVGITDEQMEAAKNLFLIFSGEQIIETTRQGQVVQKNNQYGNIYINGVKVAEEENFLFSYNITNLSAAIKKALNRERTNVGRTAYTDSIKKILLASSKKEIAKILASDLANISFGTAHDELSWIDVQEHSVKILNQQGKYIFITAVEAMLHPDMCDQAKNSGREIVTITETLKAKISNSKDHSGNPIVDISQFVQEYNDSFSFNFIEPEELTENEKIVFKMGSHAIKAFGGIPNNVQNIRISSTMRKDFSSTKTTLGCWDGATQSIVISREILSSSTDYYGILLHELVHAKTGFMDVTRDFETSLTNCLGSICDQLIKLQNNDKIVSAKITLITKELDNSKNQLCATELKLKELTKTNQPWYKFW